MLTVNGTEQHNDIIKPLNSVQAILIVSLAKWSRVQSTLSKMDTLGPALSVHLREVSVL